MARKKDEYKFILHHYTCVNEYLSSDTQSDDEFPNMVISFCIVVEKILKLYLHKKNPILVFETSSVKDTHSLIAAVLNKDKDLKTPPIDEVIQRFLAVYPKKLSEDGGQAIRDIYKVRNKFVHDYKPDNKLIFNEEDILNKMGLVWDMIADLAIRKFGKEEIKKSIPKRKYTEQELEKVLEEEVEQMIQNNQQNAFPITRPLTYPVAGSAFKNGIGALSLTASGDVCPRCKENSFSRESRSYNLYDYGSRSNRQLYKCESCGLEMTDRQYDIAKKIIYKKREL